MTQKESQPNQKEKSNSIQEVSAIRDKRYPPCLTVNAEVLVYRDDTIVEHKDAVPQGINDSVLILDVMIHEGTGPMKGIYKPVKIYEKCSDEVQKYNQVTIRHEREEVTVDIDG